MDVKKEKKQNTSNPLVTASFVTYAPDKPFYEQICLCRYLADLDEFFETMENNKPQKD
jgi:hypothetical protein